MDEISEISMSSIFNHDQIRAFKQKHKLSIKDLKKCLNVMALNGLSFYQMSEVLKVAKDLK